MSIANKKTRSGEIALLLRELVGTPGKIRTCDPLIRSQILYPAELRVHTVCNFRFSPIDLQTRWFWRPSLCTLQFPEVFDDRLDLIIGQFAFEGWHAVVGRAFADVLKELVIAAIFYLIGS